MTLLVDTSVWSLAYRRDTPPEVPEVHALREALTTGARVVCTGIILLELLRGFPRSPQVIRDQVGALPMMEPTLDEYVEAASLRNSCRAAGVQLTSVDALIAALCIAHELTLLTTDHNFHHVSDVIPLRVWSQ
jgi:predicted nucleic acid-binding protein